MEQQMTMDIDPIRELQKEAYHKNESVDANARSIMDQFEYATKRMGLGVDNEAAIAGLRFQKIMTVQLCRIATALETANALGMTDLSGAVEAEAETKAKKIVEDKSKRTFIGQKPA